MQKVLTLFIRINVCMLMLMCECNSLGRFLSFIQEACSNVSDKTRKKKQKNKNIGRKKHNSHTFEGKSHNSPRTLNDWLRVFLLILHFSPKLFLFEPNIRGGQRKNLLLQPRFYHAKKADIQNIKIERERERARRWNTNRPWCRRIRTCISILRNRKRLGFK